MWGSILNFSIEPVDTTPAHPFPIEVVIPYVFLL